MCNCKICQYGREVKKNLEFLPDKQKEFFLDMYERISMCEENDEMEKYSREKTELRLINRIDCLEAIQTELLTCIKYNIDALSEAITIAPIDKIPDKAGSALQDSQHYYDKYSGRR